MPKNPLPNIATFKEIGWSIIINIALNFIAGSITGGVSLQADTFVIIAPTQRSVIWITGLIVGLILGIILCRTVGKQAIPDIAVLKDSIWLRILKKMPKGQRGMTILMCLFSMIASAFILTAIMYILEIDALNFYQLCLLLSLYAVWFSRILGKILVCYKIAIAHS